MSTTRLASCDSWDLLFWIGWASGNSSNFFLGGGVLGYFAALIAFCRFEGGVGGGVYFCVLGKRWGEGMGEDGILCEVFGVSVAEIGQGVTAVVLTDADTVVLHMPRLMLPTLDNAADSAEGVEGRGLDLGEEPSTLEPPVLGLPDPDLEATNRLVKCQSQWEWFSPWSCLSEEKTNTKKYCNYKLHFNIMYIYMYVHSCSHCAIDTSQKEYTGMQHQEKLKLLRMYQVW